MKKKGMLLSGGSILGAMQVGAIQQVISEGFEPDFIDGISVGALNGAFLSNEIGSRGDQVTWLEIANSLEKFWLKNIRQPSDLIKKRKPVKLAWQILRKRFNGMVSTEPLQKLVRNILNADHLRTSTVDFTCGAVDMISGKIRYFNKLDNNLIDAVIASSAIPLIMPLVHIGGNPYYDGGLRDIAPLKNAIDRGVDELVIIACQPEELPSKSFETGNLMHQATRVMEIVANEIINNDIARLLYYNRLIAEGDSKNEELLEGKRHINCRVIRPQSALGVKIDSFNTNDIREMIEIGRITAFNTAVEGIEDQEGEERKLGF